MSPPEAVSGMQGRCLAGRYRLVDLVGSGGAGNVWAAVDEVLGRRVAVKDVGAPPWLSVEGWEALRERTLREARAAAVIGHPNVVTVYDVVEEDSRPWIVMQLVEARSLSQIIEEEGPCPPSRVAEIGLQVLAALQAAHDHGILHRDVKPSNVLVEEDGRAVLTDFGIATVDGDAALTASGVLVGAPAYIAPERVQGGAAGPASDLWSLGATLYTAVEGRPPYRRDSPITTIAAVVHDDPEPPSRAGVLAPLLESLLRREPEQRPSAPEVERYLRRIVSAAPGLGAELAAADVEPLPSEPVPMTPAAPIGAAAAAAGALGATAATAAVAGAGATTGPRATTGTGPLPTDTTVVSEPPDRSRLRATALLAAAAATLLAILLTGYLARHTIEPGSPSHRPATGESAEPEPVADVQGGTSAPRQDRPAATRNPAAPPTTGEQPTTVSSTEAPQPSTGASSATATQTSAPQPSQTTTAAEPPPTTDTTGGGATATGAAVTSPVLP